MLLDEKIENNANLKTNEDCFDDNNTQNTTTSTQSSIDAISQSNANLHPTQSTILDEHAYYNPMYQLDPVANNLNFRETNRELHNINGDNTIKYELPEPDLFDKIDINTNDIASRLRVALTNNDISRELFGEAILNSSRKVTNQILTNPKTFKTHTKLYQLRFWKVKMWLDDPYNIEKIRSWKMNNNCKLKLTQA